MAKRREWTMEFGVKAGIWTEKKTGNFWTEDFKKRKAENQNISWVLEKSLTDSQPSLRQVKNSLSSSTEQTTAVLGTG